MRGPLFWTRWRPISRSMPRIAAIKRSGSFVGIESYGAVQEPRLVGKINWLSFIERRNRHDSTFGFEARDGLPQLVLAVSYV